MVHKQYEEMIHKMSKEVIETLPKEHRAYAAGLGVTVSAALILARLNDMDVPATVDIAILRLIANQLEMFEEELRKQHETVVRTDKEIQH